VRVFTAVREKQVASIKSVEGIQSATGKLIESYLGRVLRVTWLAPDIVEEDRGRTAAGRGDAGGIDAAVTGTLGRAKIGPSSQVPDSRKLIIKSLGHLEE
jgi:hypothetical protein